MLAQQRREGIAYLPTFICLPESPPHHFLLLVIYFHPDLNVYKNTIPVCFLVQCVVVTRNTASLCVSLSLSRSLAHSSLRIFSAVPVPACYCSSVNGITASHCLRLRHRHVSYRSPFYVGSTPSTHPPTSVAAFRLFALGVRFICATVTLPFLLSLRLYIHPTTSSSLAQTFPSLFSAVVFDRDQEPSSSLEGHLYLFDPSLL